MKSGAWQALIVTARFATGLGLPLLAEDAEGVASVERDVDAAAELCRCGLRREEAHDEARPIWEEIADP